MGIDADPSTVGSFYLQTNGNTPFNRGEVGMTYQNSTKKDTRLF